VRIKSIGSGHSELQMVISQLKDVRQGRAAVEFIEQKKGHARFNLLLLTKKDGIFLSF
jgi:hypothetical protein